MRKKKAERDDARSTEPVARQRLTPADIQQAEFSQSFRGYNELEVDELLDRLTEDWAAAIQENKRLHEQGGAGVSGASDTSVADARKEAEEILTRARGEAAAILRNAEAGAPSGQPAVAPPVGDAAAVGPFLTKERDFLQSLGRLVQAHAESVKSMAQSARPSERAREAPATPPAAPPAAAASGADKAAARPAPGAAKQADRPTSPAQGSPVPAQQPAPAQRSSAPAAPVPQAPRPSAPRQVPASGPPTQPVVKIDPEQGPPPAREAQPQPATASRTEAPQRVDAVRIPDGPADRQAPQPSAERQGDPAAAANRSSQEDELSLRELFWGDE